PGRRTADRRSRPPSWHYPATESILTGTSARLYRVRRHHGARQRCRPPVHPTGETRMSLPIGRDRAAPTHPVLTEVTERLIARSVSARAGYLDRVTEAASAAPARTDLGCSNLAHGFAACAGPDRLAVRGTTKPGVAIVSAYNDLLSAHQP